jgi:hypothetical protein
MGPERRKRLFENIVRLRRAESEVSTPEIVAVREDLERELGETVSRSLAAQLLGVSHTALNRWIDSGDVPVVTTREGRTAVPVRALVNLYEGVNRERASGRRRLHTLEPVMTEGRERAERIRPHRVLGEEPGPRDRHRTAELRSLAYHRALAPRLRRRMVEDARRKIRQWEQAGTIDPRYAKQWDEVLRKPVAEIRKIIRADTQFARDLRQNSPFAGLLSEPERRKILETVR